MKKLNLGKGLLKKKLCPYCFERFHMGDCRVISTVNPGQILYEPPPEVWKRRLWLPDLTDSAMTREQATWECPSCQELLPDNLEHMGETLIGLVGDAGTGKSHYLTALMHTLEQGEIRSKIGCREINPKGDTQDRFWEHYYRPLFVEHVQIPKTQFPAGGRYRPLIWEFIIEARHRPRFLHSASSIRPVNLVLFDAAGEDITQATHLATLTRYVLAASGLIVLIDPLTLPGLKGRLSLDLYPSAEQPAHWLLSLIVQWIRRERRLSPGVSIPIPVAIVLSKSDLLRELPEFEHLHTFAVESSHRNGPNMDDLQQVHEEAQEVIRRLGGRALLEQCKAFSRSHFFLVSATGAPPGPDGHFPGLQPNRCADPFIWLLHALDVL